MRGEDREEKLFKKRANDFQICEPFFHTVRVCTLGNDVSPRLLSVVA